VIGQEKRLGFIPQPLVLLSPFVYRVLVREVFESSSVLRDWEEYCVSSYLINDLKWIGSPDSLL